ncbi:MAG: hypothetical protein WBD31_24530 [Rubripirellula sp.]
MRKIFSTALAAVALLHASATTAQAGVFDCLSGSHCDAAACDSGCGLGCSDGCDIGCGEATCDSACACSACGQSASLCGCLDRMNLVGLIKPSDHCFDDFISPMIDFVFFEDPRTLTELRPIFVQHRFPNQLGPGNIPAGGDLQLYALQFRLALTDRLSLIAVKDGYIVDGSKGALDGLLDSGWADVSAGLKYNLIRNTQTGTLASLGFTYEIPMGDEKALQSIGDGQLNFFGSAAQRLFGGNAHYMTSFGFNTPIDNASQTSSVHWLNHFDVKTTKKTYAFTELSWRHWTDNADVGLPLGVAGEDLLNLAATNVAGNDLVTQNVGMKYKPNGNFEAGVAYEFPLTSFEDIIRDRWQFEMIFRY